ncbi:hypothetical protein LguiA_033976 [Lonicera macranthoides]
MFKSNNVTARIFERQIRTPAPGTSVHCARRFYENVVPSFTLYDVECPDHSFRKFTDDGQYLISFSRNHQDLIVYRPSWLSFSCKEENCDDTHELPLKSKKFESFFTQLYSVTLASRSELICKDFFLYIESNRFGLFATSTAQIHDAPAIGGAVPGVPSIEKITFHLLRLEDGVVLDERVFRNDYVNLAHNMGVFLYDDLLALVSLRYQRIHILQIRDSGNLVDVRAIGEFCCEDDELFLNSNAQASGTIRMAVPDKSNKLQQVPVNNVGNGVHHHQPVPDNSFLSGIKQRLLSFIFRGIWKEETDHTLVSRNADSHPSFFAVYNMETTEIIAFYQITTDELYFLLEQFCDHFHVPSKNSLYMNFISSHSNNIHALEQLKCGKNKATSFSQLISATDRHRQSTDHPIKFISRRQPNSLKFKIKPGTPGVGPAEAAGSLARARLGAPQVESLPKQVVYPLGPRLHTPFGELAGGAED